jgi:hypothetical protein
MDGYILLHRKIRECRALRSAKPLSKFEAWVDLLMLANWKDGMIEIRGINVPVNRGQVGWSEVQLSKRWKWSRNKLRRWFNALVKEKMIERLSDSVRHQNGSESGTEMEQQNGQQNLFVTSIITITNYDKYQKTVLQDGTANETANETANGTQRIKEELKKETKKKIIIAPELFEAFWKKYPIRPSSGRKGNRSITIEKWNKLKNGEREMVLKMLDRYICCDQWKNGYSPDAERYISRRMWEDPPLIIDNKPEGYWE